jgi:hypothetical protein
MRWSGVGELDGGAKSRRLGLESRRIPAQEREQGVALGHGLSHFDPHEEARARVDAVLHARSARAETHCRVSDASSVNRCHLAATTRHDLETVWGGGKPRRIIHDPGVTSLKLDKTPESVEGVSARDGLFGLKTS